MNSHNNVRTTATVGELCELVNGRAFKPTEWGNEGVPIIRIQNLNDESKEFNFFNGNYSPKHEVNDGDLLFSWSGTPGTSFGAFFWNRGRGVLNQHIFNVHIDRARIDKRYFRYALNARLNEIIHHAHGGVGLQHITKGKLEAVEIPLPPLSEQKRIADILDKADAIRRKRQEAIGLSEQLIRSAFLEMFGDPVANPRQWSVKQLQDISTRIVSGTTPKGGKHVYPEEGITFFRSQNVWRNRIVLEDIAYIDERTHRAMARSSLKKKDILITKTGRFNTEHSSLGRAAMFMGQDDSANINGHVYLVRLDAEAIHEFILFILTMDEYREHIRRVCVGGIDKRQINKEHLEEFPIIAPPRNLQLRFAAIVKSHERQLERMKTQLAEANDLFSSLVQRAFKGEL